VSSPRRTVGTNPAGRLPATMLRALAAELSDTGRFSRAKAYARDGAVVDIDVHPGEARGVVQGSRADPYAVTLYTEPAAEGEGLLGLVPGADELVLQCSCPDADTSGACKHALAVLLVLADEVSIEPAVLARWRSVPDGAERPAARHRVTEESDVDVLADALAAPAPLPELPEIPQRVPVPMPSVPGTRDADVAAAVAAAIAVLRSR
jgi:uncharacterized Zn finger protein